MEVTDALNGIGRDDPRRPPALPEFRVWVLHEAYETRFPFDDPESAV